ncbi:MAG TPA: HPr family phosphocarrier protein [Phycisphaerae bacterium]|nr:HPr family phosphocarrier protein [Phycisphaerae bacterium]
MQSTGRTLSNMDRQITISNKLGLHARPAMQFVDLANQFRSTIKVWKGEQCVDGKSIMHMMMLAATEGTGLKIQADGEDAQKALDALEQLINGKFGEE